MTSLSKMKLPSYQLDQTMDDAFPAVDPGEMPYGSLVLVQMKRPALKTKGGIALTGNDAQTEYDNTKVAKVLRLGPVCFRNRETGAAWPEGAWFNEGDYIRLSQHNVRSWSVPVPGTRGIGKEERIVLGYIDELHVQGRVEDPLATQAFF